VSTDPAAGPQAQHPQPSERAFLPRSQSGEDYQRNHQSGAHPHASVRESRIAALPSLVPCPSSLFSRHFALTIPGLGIRQEELYADIGVPCVVTKPESPLIQDLKDRMVMVTVTAAVTALHGVSTRATRSSCPTSMADRSIWMRSSRRCEELDDGRSKAGAIVPVMFMRICAVAAWSCWRCFGIRCSIDRRSESHACAYDYT
jgi:hypothetical protein